MKKIYKNFQVFFTQMEQLLTAGSIFKLSRKLRTNNGQVNHHEIKCLSIYINKKHQEILISSTISCMLVICTTR